MNFWRVSVFILLFPLLLGSCGQGGCQAPWVAPQEKLLGSQAPNFTLSNLAGEKVELASVVSQKPTLLVFWATWCPSCVEEIPLLNEWSEKYPGLQILSINVQEPRDRIQEFAEKRGIRYPVLLDEEALVTEQYGLVGIPATILLARGGQVIYYGFALPENIESFIGS